MVCGGMGVCVEDGCLGLSGCFRASLGTEKVTQVIVKNSSDVSIADATREWLLEVAGTVMACPGAQTLEIDLYPLCSLSEGWRLELGS